jgi:hypothetical protein
MLFTCLIKNMRHAKLSINQSSLKMSFFSSGDVPGSCQLNHLLLFATVEIASFFKLAAAGPEVMEARLLASTAATGGAVLMALSPTAWLAIAKIDRTDGGEVVVNAERGHRIDIDATPVGALIFQYFIYVTSSLIYHTICH